MTLLLLQILSPVPWHTILFLPPSRQVERGAGLYIYFSFPVLSSSLSESTEQWRRWKAAGSGAKCISALCSHLHFGRHRRTCIIPSPSAVKHCRRQFQQELAISLTDEDKEGEQSEKARGLNTFQVPDWKERPNLDSEIWALSGRVNSLWQ